MKLTMPGQKIVKASHSSFVNQKGTRGVERGMHLYEMIL